MEPTVKLTAANLPKKKLTEEQWLEHCKETAFKFMEIKKQLKHTIAWQAADIREYKEEIEKLKEELAMPWYNKLWRNVVCRLYLISKWLS